jgi:uncharacterized protein YgfB (UPF0149 family)
VRTEEFDPSSLFEDTEIALDARGRSDLNRVTDETLAALADTELGFMPVLPPDDAALTERARALGAWCEGFLHGLASRSRLDLEACSEEVREIVKDFAQFTRASFAAADDLEVEESAYAELVEYIRVGVQLVFVELHPRGDSGLHDRPTLH